MIVEKKDLHSKGIKLKKKELKINSIKDWFHKRGQW